MSEQATPYPGQEPDENQLRGNLSLEDALLVASDAKVKEYADWAAANRRVARKLSEGVANGESAIPGIKDRAKLARIALGVSQYGLPKIDKSISGRLKRRAAKQELKGQNYNMLIEEDRVAAKPGYSFRNPYEVQDRGSMSPDQLAEAELQKAQEVSYAAVDADRWIDKRTEELLSRKATATNVLGRLDSQQGANASQLELTSGKSWNLYNNETGALDAEATAASILDTIRSTPGLQELVAKGLNATSKEK